MADELTTNFRLLFDKGNLHVRLPVTDASPEKTFDVAGTGFVTKEQEIATGGEVISGAEDISANGFIYLENLDDTNYVSVMQESLSREVIRLKAGDFCFFRAGSHFNDGTGTGFFLKADTAACKVFIAWFDA